MGRSTKDVILSRREIENLIARGRQIFIVNDRVIKADAWMKFHPGGDLAIKHMIGRDATDEVTVLHTPEARKRMESYEIGRITGVWKNFTPPIQGGQFRLLEHDDMVSDAEGEGNGENDNFDEENEDDRNKIQKSPKADEAKKEKKLEGKEGATKPGCGVDQSPITLPVGDSNNKTAKAPNPPITLTRRHQVSASTTPSSTPDQSQQYLLDQAKIELDADLAKYPALDTITQQRIVKQYRALYKEIIAKGFFECNYWNYAFEVSRYLLLFYIFVTTLRSGWYKVSGMFLGLFWHQLVFSAHDAGHMGITHNYQFDTMIGIIIADFIGGLSMGWWKRSHNVHHIVTNSLAHDPDIQLLPFFAVSHGFFDSLYSSYHSKFIDFDKFSKALVPYQHYLYYPVLCLGRFNLYLQGWLFLMSPNYPRKGPARWHRTMELVGQVFFWYWFGYIVLYKSIPSIIDRVAFVLISHVITAPLHVQITMSHYAMSTADLGEDECFAQKMLRTTMDVDCPQWLDFIHGGLQFQAIHHLYPKIPRHNLRSVQSLVQQFCRDVDIPYALLGFVDGNKEVISHLAEVGRHATIFASCHEAVIRSPDFGFH